MYEFGDDYSQKVADRNKRMLTTMMIGAFCLLPLIGIIFTFHHQYERSEVHIPEWNKGGYKGLIWPILQLPKAAGILGKDYHPRSLLIGPSIGCQWRGRVPSSYCKGLYIPYSQVGRKYVNSMRGWSSGIIIYSPEGTPVVSMADGIVTNVRQRRPFNIGMLSKKQINKLPTRYAYIPVGTMDIVSINLRKYISQRRFDDIPYSVRVQISNGRWISDYYGNQVTVVYLKGTLKATFSFLQRVIVFPGQKVKRGQPIGAVGVTGSAITSRLHLSLQLLVDKKYVVVNPRYVLPVNIPEQDSHTAYIGTRLAVSQLYMMGKKSFPKHVMKPHPLLYPAARVIGSEVPYGDLRWYGLMGKQQYWKLREIVAEVLVNRYYLFNKLYGKWTARDIVAGKRPAGYGRQNAHLERPFNTDKKPHYKDLAISGQKIFGYSPWITKTFGWITDFTFNWKHDELAKQHTGIYLDAHSIHYQLCKKRVLYVVDARIFGFQVAHVSLYGRVAGLTKHGRKQLRTDSQGCLWAPKMGFGNPAEDIAFYGLYRQGYVTP